MCEPLVAVTGEHRSVQWEDPELEEPDEEEDEDGLTGRDRAQEMLGAQRGAVLVLGRAPNAVVTPFHIKRGRGLVFNEEASVPTRIEQMLDGAAADPRQVEYLFAGEAGGGGGGGGGGGERLKK